MPKDSPFVKEDIPTSSKSMIIPIVVIILIICVAYYGYITIFANDGFLQSQPKTGPEVENTLDVEGQIALFNKMQETYFT